MEEAQNILLTNPPDNRDERQVRDDRHREEVQRVGEREGRSVRQGKGQEEAEDAEAAHQHRHGGEQAGKVAVHKVLDIWDKKIRLIFYLRRSRQI